MKSDVVPDLWRPLVRYVGLEVYLVKSDVVLEVWRPLVKSDLEVWRPLVKV